MDTHPNEMPFTGDDVDVVATSREVLAHHARTFRLASVLLPSSQRDEAAVVYAFCRLVDDTVDEAPDHDSARAGLALLEDELLGRRPARPLIGGFLEVCRLRHIPLTAATELIAGVESDLGTVLIPNDRELLRYCYRVAGTVGIMMCGVIGVTDPDALAHAIDLGVGMQLTNICRDVLEDAGRGRVYLPATRLNDLNTSHEEILAGTAPSYAVGWVISDLLALADRYYLSGEQGMRFIPSRPRAAIAAAGRMYRAIGWKLRSERNCDFTRGRTVVGRRSKARWLTSAVAFAARAPLSLRPQHDPMLHHHLQGLPGVHRFSAAAS